MTEFHIYCPECGEYLSADVEVWSVNVPLRCDGFITDEGTTKETKITKTYCKSCGWSEEGSHYYHTGEVVDESAENKGGEQDD
jgi:predicted RNA-binding Zn-ribbon protein involved in translation (DUF1610 family)